MNKAIEKLLIESSDKETLDLRHLSSHIDGKKDLKSLYSSIFDRGSIVGLNNLYKLCCYMDVRFTDIEIVNDKKVYSIKHIPTLMCSPFSNIRVLKGCIDKLEYAIRYGVEFDENPHLSQRNFLYKEGWLGPISKENFSDSDLVMIHKILNERIKTIMTDVHNAEPVEYRPIYDRTTFLTGGYFCYLLQKRLLTSPLPHLDLGKYKEENIRYALSIGYSFDFDYNLSFERMLICNQLRLRRRMRQEELEKECYVNMYDLEFFQDMIYNQICVHDVDVTFMIEALMKNSDVFDWGFFPEEVYSYIEQRINNKDENSDRFLNYYRIMFSKTECVSIIDENGNRDEYESLIYTRLKVEEDRHELFYVKKR